MSSNTADRIREAAHDLIAARGYFGFSYADIADVVGIRKASIHYHFPSKVDLAVAALTHYRATLVNAAKDLDRKVTDPFQRLKLYVQHWEACIHNSNRPICIAALLSGELPALPEPIAAEVQLHFKYLAGWVKSTHREGVKHGSIHLEHSLEVEAQSFVALVHGAMFSARALGSPDLFTSITKGALDRLRDTD
jgi:TetR/AcrR family transcriptional repressor of nem operon